MTSRYILLFILIQLTSLVLTIIGLPILALLSILELWTSSTPAEWIGGYLTWIWSNEIDGIFGPGNPQTRWQGFYWSALRNPVNNLRFVPGVSKIGRPLFQYRFKGYYFQCGWNVSGYPVLSAGKGNGTQ